MKRRTPSPILWLGRIRSNQQPEDRSASNDDLDLSQPRFARPSYRLFVRNARRDQVVLGARLQNEIHGLVPVAFSPFVYNVRCLMAQRGSEVLPLKIVS